MGEKKRTNRKGEATAKEISWMQLQRSCGIPVGDICKNTGFAESTIYKHVKDVPALPAASLPNSTQLLQSLLLLTVQDAFKAWEEAEDLAVHKELGLQINRHVDSLQRIMEISDATEHRAMLEALAQNIQMLAESGEMKAAELLQKEYDKLHDDL